MLWCFLVARTLKIEMTQERKWRRGRELVLCNLSQKLICAVWDVFMSLFWESPFVLHTAHMHFERNFGTPKYNYLSLSLSNLLFKLAFELRFLNFITCSEYQTKPMPIIPQLNLLHHVIPHLVCALSGDIHIMWFLYTHYITLIGLVRYQHNWYIDSWDLPLPNKVKIVLGD